MYYCTGLYNQMVLIGSGSRVIVNDPAPLNPSIIMYSPMDVSGPAVPLQCLVMGAVPSQVQVHWMIDHTEQSGWTESSWIENSDSALEYTRARITLSEEEWREAAQIECVVAYNGTNISRTLLPRGNNEGICSWLLYLAFGAAFLTVAVTVTVAVFLRKVLTWRICHFRHRARKMHSKNQKPVDNTGKRDTIRPAAEVEYSCLNPDSLNQHLNAVQTKLQ
ncbi:hypothetical protein NFI96_028206 [Prochilodus magdalenae]|nr:hypothetical protein NFI96_028206 [Prochilodus magdalenae]